jgi:hypothetical protein
MPDGAESVVDAASIPAGAQSIAAFSASGQPTRLTGSPAPRAATAATEAPARGATSTQPEVIGRWVPELGRFVSPAEEAQMKQQGR